MNSLLFEIYIPYDVSLLAPIQKLAVKFGPWIQREGYYASFRLKDLNEVIALTKQNITFNEEEVNTLINFCPPLKEKVNMFGDKGISGLKVSDYPEYYECIEWRKDIDGVPNETKTIIPRANVDAVGFACNEIGIERTVKHSCVAEHVCRKLGVTRFFRENSGTFDFPKYFGSRGFFFKTTYYPLKILSEKGFINYDKKGKVTVLKEYTVQTKI